VARFISRLHTVAAARDLSDRARAALAAGKAGKARSLRKQFDKVTEAAEDAGHVPLHNALQREHEAKVMGRDADAHRATQDIAKLLR
jgi:hypothetical protein